MFKKDTYALLRKNFYTPFNAFTSKGEKLILLKNGSEQYLVPFEKYNEALDKLDQYHALSDNFNEPEVFEDMIERNMKPTKKQVNKYIKLLRPNEYHDNVYLKLSLSNGTARYITLSNNSTKEIKNILKQNFVEFVPHTSFGSDVIEQIYTKDIVGIEHFRIYPDDKLYRNSNNWAGEYFSAINKTKIDLIKYQIYTAENYEEKQKHCIISALEQQGIEEELLTRILTSFQDCFSFPISKLPNLATSINRTIHLYTFRHHNDDERKSKTNIEIKKYEIKDTEPVKIALYKNHYFTYEDTIYSKYSIEHYEEVKEEKDFNDIIKINLRRGQFERSKKGAKLSSIHLVKLMDELNMFDWNNKIIQKTRAGDNNLDPLNIILDNIHEEQTFDPKQDKEDARERAKEENSCDYNPEEHPEDFMDGKNGKQKSKLKPTILEHFFYADLEAIVKDKIHKPFMSGIIKKGETKPLITMSKSEECTQWFYVMMNYVATKTPKNLKPDHKNEIWDIHIPIVFFHNLKYDLHMMMKHLNINSSCKKDGLYYQYKIKYDGREIILRDSYKMINVALAKFKKMFNLTAGKEEAINYTFYDFENINKEKHDVEEYKDGLNGKDKIKFDDIMKKPKKIFKYDKKARTFDAVAYYKYYLKQDVMTLYEGLEKFNLIMRDVAGLRSYDYITISRLAFEYFNKNNCFEGVAYCNGNLRQYLSNAVYGGRVHVNEAIKGKIITAVLNDYDANSLYPSAFARMCDEGQGLAKGFAKVIQEEHKIYDNIKKLNYYVVTVKITKINKKQNNPFIQIRKDDISEYINDLPDNKPVITTIDKITLEDYIKFHEIEFEILKGVYYNEGFNNKIGEVVKKLYNDRMKFKKTNEQMATIIKLILNSTYGKTIPKKSYEKVHYVKEKDLEKFIYKNYSNIKGFFYKVSKDQYEVTTATTDDTYNLASVGIKCLSYSKRIMNEVMGLASDNDILIYYQDTDSMHIKDVDIERLEALYRHEYGKELHGKGLGQFGSDFEIEGCKNVKSMLSCFLGKKSYFDMLLGEDEKTGEIKIGHHIRLKGITEGGIQDAIERYGSEISLFDSLANGEKVEFVLNAKRAMFLYGKTKNTVTTHEEREHIRELQFI